MASLVGKLLLLIVVTWLAGFAGARGPFIETALKNGPGLADCWSALLELRSCTNDIVLFFLDGESNLSLDCCRAVRVITRECWPTMLTSLGFSVHEGDVLRGYCDAETEISPAPHNQLPPVAAPIATV